MNQEENTKKELQQSYQPNQRYVDDDEISLIDLFVVLLRWRWLIVGITALALLVAIVGYLFYLPYQHQKAQEGQMVEASMTLLQRPIIKELEAEVELEEVLKNPTLILMALRDAGFESIGYGEDPQIDITGDAQRPEALSYIRNRIIENRDIDGNALEADQSFYKVQRRNNTLQIMYKHEDSSGAEAFLDAIYLHGESNIKNLLRPHAELAVRTYERLLNIEDPNQGVREAMSNRAGQYDLASRFLSEEVEVLSRPSGIIFYNEPSPALESFQDSFKIKGIVLVLAALFLSIFLAFVLNAFDNVRNDEESMRKINEALHKNTNKNTSKK